MRQDMNQANLLGIKDTPLSTIQSILTQAATYKSILNSDSKHVDALQGKVIVQLFFEPSTRTRLAFEMAIRRMGAEVMNVDIDHSSVKKGESLKDTVQNIAALGVDGFIVRHAEVGAAEKVASYVSVPVINAGDGTNEHPTQALLDLFTMQEKLGDMTDKHVLIWGDIKHSRVARSNIYLLNKVGAKVFLGGPEALMPDPVPTDVSVITDFDASISRMDVLNVLRIQYERDNAEAFPTPESFCKAYGVTSERLKAAKDSILVMHPGPVNRNVEMSSEVLDNRCVALEQVANGVAVRMAVLAHLLG